MLIDENKRGEIATGDVMRALSDLDEVTKLEVEYIIQDIDKNRTGVIDLADFFETLLIENTLNTSQIKSLAVNLVKQSV